jgi:hypothetical protein
MHVMHNTVEERNFFNHNVEPFGNAWFVQKPTFPSKTITRDRLTKGNRESFIYKLQQFTGTQEIILL